MLTLELASEVLNGRFFFLGQFIASQQPGKLQVEGVPGVWRAASTQTGTDCTGPFAQHKRITDPRDARNFLSFARKNQKHIIGATGNMTIIVGPIARGARIKIHALQAPEGGRDVRDGKVKNVFSIHLQLGST